MPTPINVSFFNLHYEKKKQKNLLNFISQSKRRNWKFQVFKFLKIPRALCWNYLCGIFFWWCNGRNMGRLCGCKKVSTSLWVICGPRGGKTAVVLHLKQNRYKNLLEFLGNFLCSRQMLVKPEIFFFFQKRMGIKKAVLQLMYLLLKRISSSENILGVSLNAM